MRLLLSLGASDKQDWITREEGALVLAAQFGQTGAVAVLLDMGLEAVGGADAVRAALRHVIKFGHAKMLHLLLGVEGEEMRAWWANWRMGDKFPMVLAAAMGCYLTATSVLLAAGADEQMCFDNTGVCLSEKIGVVFDDDDRDEAKETAVRRMLKRGPAFRAGSYCWPVQTGAAMGVDSGLAPSGGRAKPNVPLGVCIFRPNVVSS